MHTEDYILDALEMVSAWDVPEEDLADAVNDQARLMAGIDPDGLLGVVQIRQLILSITSLSATLPSSLPKHYRSVCIRNIPEDVARPSKS